jgi:hypothetical protein
VKIRADVKAFDAMCVRLIGRAFEIQKLLHPSLMAELDAHIIKHRDEIDEDELESQICELLETSSHAKSQSLLFEWR